MKENIIFAKDIDDCSVCPLYEHDCPGGWTSGGGGTPIEPPCCSWNDDDEIYEGMYEYNQYEPSEQEILWAREYIEQKEKEQREQREKEYKEDVEKRVNSISHYGNAKVKSGGGLCYDWYCPHCNRWFHAWSESSHNGLTETHCIRCGEPLAHSWVLDE